MPGRLGNFALMLLLDTHAWVWYLSDPQQLSAPALAEIEKAVQGTGVCVSAISLWEVALLVGKGRLQFSISLHDWLQYNESLNFLKVVPLDGPIVLTAAELPNFHPDPADRFIVATGLVNRWSLVTKDQKIRDYSAIPTIW